MSQSLSITLWAVGIMVVPNVLMVVLTVGTKAARGLRGCRTKASTSKLKSVLDDSMITGKTHPDLLDLNERKTDLLAILMVEYLSVLSGAERDRLVCLAAQSELVGRYFARLRSRNRDCRGALCPNS